MPAALDTTFRLVTACWNCAPLSTVGTAIFETSLVKASIDAHK
jgi:hypothetical protein